MDEQTIHILLVEDEEAHTELIRRAFERHTKRFHLTVVGDLEKARAYLAEFPPNLVITDWLLPDGRGTDLLPVEGEARHFPLVIMTSHGDEQVAVDAIKAGALDYVVKSAKALSNMPRVAERALREWGYITERKLAEEALQESEKKFRSIVEQSNDGIVMTDEQGIIIEWNQGQEQISGLKRTEVLGKPIWDVQFQLTVKEQKTRAIYEERKNSTQEFFRTGQAPWLHQLHETEIQRPNGTHRTVQSSVSSIKTDKGILVVSTFRDVTEQKQLEEQMRQQEQMAAIGQLAGGIAHDFNNILATIILYTQMFLRKDYLPPDMTSGLETILDEAKQAAHLVRQILDFSRRSTMQTQLVDLLPLAEKVMDILQRTLPANIHLFLDIEPAGAYIVDADPARIQQAMMNLAVNARDAMPEGGELRFSLSRVQVKPGVEPPVLGMGSGKWMCLTVSDMGTGISTEAMDHLFEPFFTTKAVGKGTGLGLAQVYGIVELHHGYIGVKSELGKGSTFGIYLPIPVEKKEETLQTETLPAAPEGTGEIILLVEDGDKLRDLAKLILESLGYKVLAAVNGHEALKVYQSAEKIDLVITDIMMPKMGGEKLMQELRKIDPDLKGLALTGYALTEEREKLKQIGIMGFIQKPFDIDTIADIVRQVLDVE
ncbi:MAG: response regulator [Chloroflexi bacterium]|nr:response regulator [Chloroflexota bacterium]